MNGFLRNLKLTWYYMFNVPWRHSKLRGNELASRQLAHASKTLYELAATRSFDVRRMVGTLQPGQHWFRWIVGWMYALCGLVGGALVAPSLVRWAALSWFPYQDWLVIGIAAITGFLVHLLGWVLIANSFVPAGLTFRISNRVSNRIMRSGGLDRRRRTVILVLGTCAILSAVAGLVVALLLPLAAVGFGIYRYLTWIGPGQRTVTVAFVGGLLVKTLISPLFKYIMGSVVFTRILRWLRSDKTKAKSA